MICACLCLVERDVHVPTGEKPANLAQARVAGSRPGFHLELPRRRPVLFFERDVVSLRRDAVA